MKYIFIILVSVFISCRNNYILVKENTLLDTLSVYTSYTKGKFIKNYIPNNDDILKIEENISKNKIKNNNEFFSKKEFVKINKNWIRQYSGAIDLRKDTIIFITVILKQNDKNYDFQKNNYFWNDSQPFTRKRREYFVVEYNLSKRASFEILNVSNYPKSEFQTR